jgi:hypothetical protein
MFDFLPPFYARRRIHVSPFPRNLFHQGPQHIHILLRNLSADAKDHKILCDSAGARTKRRLVMSC